MAGGIEPGTDTRTLTYNGSGTLTVNVSSNQSWLAVSFDNGSSGNTLTGGNSGTIAATVADVSAPSTGQHTATISVRGNDGRAQQRMGASATLYQPCDICY